MRRYLSILIPVALLAIAGISHLDAQESGGPEALVGSDAPGFELDAVNQDEPIDLSDYEGQVIILDFWATWCPPCRREIPGFIELQEEFGDEGLTVIGASLDREGPSVVESFIDEYGINYPTGMANQEVHQAYGSPRSIPTTYVIDRSGTIRNVHVGFASKDEFQSEIEPLLAESTSQGE